MGFGEICETFRGLIDTGAFASTAPPPQTACQQLYSSRMQKALSAAHHACYSRSKAGTDFATDHRPAARNRVLRCQSDGRHDKGFLLWGVWAAWRRQDVPRQTAGGYQPVGGTTVSQCLYILAGPEKSDTWCRMQQLQWYLQWCPQCHVQHLGVSQWLQSDSQTLQPQAPQSLL